MAKNKEKTPQALAEEMRSNGIANAYYASLPAHIQEQVQMRRQNIQSQDGRLPQKDTPLHGGQ